MLTRNQTRLGIYQRHWGTKERKEKGHGPFQLEKRPCLWHPNTSLRRRVGSKNFRRRELNATHVALNPTCAISLWESLQAWQPIISIRSSKHARDVCCALFALPSFQQNGGRERETETEREREGEKRKAKGKKTRHKKKEGKNVQTLAKMPAVKG